MAMLVDSEKLGSGAALSEAEKMQRERKRHGEAQRHRRPMTGRLTVRRILVPLDGDTLPRRRRRQRQASPRASARGRRSTRRSAKPANISPSFATSACGPRRSAHRPSRSAGPRQAGSLGRARVHRPGGNGRVTPATGGRRRTTRIAVERFDEARSTCSLAPRSALPAPRPSSSATLPPARIMSTSHCTSIDPNGAHKVQVDLGPNRDIYLARVNWAPDGKKLYVQRLNRAQTTLDMLAVDPATGKSKMLFSERRAGPLDQPRATITDSSRTAA